MVNKLLKIGELSFLLGVSLLIIRKNNYPWPLKRASDILFIISTLSVFLFIFFRKDWGSILRPFFKIKWALGLIFIGILIASINGYLNEGLKIDSQGLLSLSRFIEVIAIILLMAFFQSKDKKFYKKVGLFQLTTLIYTFAIIIYRSNYLTSMYRFELFENYASNVGYYLIVSLSLVTVFILSSLKPFNKNLFIPNIIAGTTLSGIILWTQSRASWVGVAISLFIILLVWAKKSIREITVGGLLMTLIIVIGFLVLPHLIRSEVITRVFPGLDEYMTRHKVNLRREDLGKIKNVILKEGYIPSLYEPSRPALWRAYSYKLLKKPLGLGLNYSPVIYENSPRGPHNTFLEIAVIGGIISLAGFGYLLFLAFKNIFIGLQSKIDFPWSLYILASLTGLVIASLFDNMSTFRLMWIIISLAIFFPTNDFIKKESAL